MIVNQTQKTPKSQASNGKAPRRLYEHNCTNPPHTKFDWSVLLNLRKLAAYKPMVMGSNPSARKWRSAMKASHHFLTPGFEPRTIATLHEHLTRIYSCGIITILSGCVIKNSRHKPIFLCCSWFGMEEILPQKTTQKKGPPKMSSPFFKATISCETKIQSFFLEGEGVGERNWKSGGNSMYVMSFHGENRSRTMFLESIFTQKMWIQETSNFSSLPAGEGETGIPPQILRSWRDTTGTLHVPLHPIC